MNLLNETQIDLVNMKVTKVDVDLEKGLFSIKFDNGEALVCRLVKSLTNGGYRRVLDLEALGVHSGKPLRKNEWLQIRGHHYYQNFDDMVFVIAREARLLGVPTL